MDRKICTGCGIEKPITEFNYRADRPGKRRSKCIECFSKIQNKCNKEHYRKNKDKILETNKIWRLNNPDKLKEGQIKYQKENRESINKNYSKYVSERKQSDLSFKVLINTKRRILIALQKQSASKTDSTYILTGLTGESLYSYLKEKGYGLEKNHIDHYIPLSKFQLSNKDHQMIAFYYMNLQPLAAHENHIKSDTLPDDWKEKIYQICEVRNINPQPIINHIKETAKC